MNPYQKQLNRQKEERATSINQTPLQVEIRISKGNQEIRLSPEEYSRLAKRMENAFINSLIVVNE